MPIQILDDNTINKIAAGEVIERPASVAKELVENSLDAKATVIDIELINGGKTLIDIADNGCGMSPADAHLALKRHATSKLRQAEDLFYIQTLGFRGEALPSIAAVSDFSLETRLLDTDLGFKLKSKAGGIIEEGPIGTAEGTRIQVRDLFHNLPARRKFLKTDQTELSQVISFLEKVILAHPNLRLTLKNNGKIILKSTGSGKLLEAIISVYGKELVDQLATIDFKTPDQHYLTGYAARPDYLKNDRQGQAIFVNNRPIYNPMINKAIQEGYRNRIPAGKYPYVFLFLTLPSQMVDINVHPTKKEVRFAKSHEVYAAVRSAVASALEQVTPLNQHQSCSEQHLTSWPALTTPRAPVEAPSLDILPLPSRPPAPRVIPNHSPSASYPVSGVPRADKLFQLADTYLVLGRGSELQIIDQHAAHERILFERFRQQAHAKQPDSQQLLVPATLSFSAAEAVLLVEFLPLLGQLGFELEDFGQNTYLLRAVPTDLIHNNPENALQELFVELGYDRDARLNQDHVLKMLACKAAIKAGDRLTIPEMQALLQELALLPAGVTCPHGRPAVITLTPNELEKRLGRQ